MMVSTFCCVCWLFVFLFNEVCVHVFLDLFFGLFTASVQKYNLFL